MNLYGFSQVNNYEMGILVDKDEDADLYAKINDEAMRLVRISDEIQITIAQIPKNPEKPAKQSVDKTGFCIRCHTETKLNPMIPYCRGCYGAWKQKNEDESHEESFCHICGKSHKSSLLKPTCYDCYKANKNKLEFPLQTKKN